MEDRKEYEVLTQILLTLELISNKVQGIKAQLKKEDN